LQKTSSLSIYYNRERPRLWGDELTQLRNIFCVLHLTGIGYSEFAHPHPSLQRSLSRTVCKPQLFRPARLKNKPTICIYMYIYIYIYLSIYTWHIPLQLYICMSICPCKPGWMRVASCRIFRICCPDASEKAHTTAVAFHKSLDIALYVHRYIYIYV
jgi:hypothetical protein